ncbi:protein-methionine-sulfoxide reductase catalytic subunit MsrP [Chloroflexota bacterium]
MVNIHSHEITPEHVYVTRRKFMAGLGTLVAGALLFNGCRGQDSFLPPDEPAGGLTPVDLKDELTPYEDVISYNNFYEFSLNKGGIDKLSKDLRVSPWTVEMGGLVNKPQVLAIEDLLRKYPQEERIYRMRCVEGWSMVIPWLGFPLGQLLRDVEPMSTAKYVRFETLYDPEQMPGLNRPVLEWPYVEGLRLDEAMHDLTILTSGLYGKPILPQNGAPLRLIVPWKYGFKSIKSIVRIDLTEEMPVSAWMGAAPREYGFYANVNPNVSHPRWSQSTERRIGDQSRRPTLFLNGYAEEVSHLYTDMDLKKFY